MRALAVFVVLAIALAVANPQGRDGQLAESQAAQTPPDGRGAPPPPDNCGTLANGRKGRCHHGGGYGMYGGYGMGMGLGYGGLYGGLGYGGLGYGGLGYGGLGYGGLGYGGLGLYGRR